MTWLQKVAHTQAKHASAKHFHMVSDRILSYHIREDTIYMLLSGRVQKLLQPPHFSMLMRDHSTTSAVTQGEQCSQLDPC
jgi:hypothetical protein